MHEPLSSDPMPGVFVGSAFVAKYPNGGGNYWVPLQYLLGLRDLGVDAWWLEMVASTGDGVTDRLFRDTFLDAARRLGVADRVVLVELPDGFDRPDSRVVHGMSTADLAARCRDGLLLNLAESIPGNIRPEFGRTVLMDIDPGPFQIWGQQWDFGIGTHDVHVTIGQHLGAPDSPIPLGGVTWHKVWPTVYLPAWPVQTAPGVRFTTVTQWWSQEYAFLGEETYDCNKRTSFMEFVNLPGRTHASLELAANIHPTETDDLALLAAKGWHVCAPETVVRTPEQYRGYVQTSRGEFSCAKPAYVKARSGWVSDRTICYLASGRPAVVQDTGAAVHLPATPGLQFYRTLDEAAAALERVESDYARAAREARDLAESTFSTAAVLPHLLAIAGW